VAAERIGYLRDAIAELPDRARRVVTGYYLENRQLTELADELGVTQSRASQLRAEALDLLHEALSRLLTDDARVGIRTAGPAPSGPGAEGDGVRARRREAYVAAVAHRSTVRDRADVQAYLNGAALHASRDVTRDLDQGVARAAAGVHPLGA
jgi:RNA polymerase sigma factor for flagellar operon FliA